MYPRHFDTRKSINDAKEASKLFSVPDFVGDACKAIASRVRGAVAQCKFDDFHKASCMPVGVCEFVCVECACVCTCGWVCMCDFKRRVLASRSSCISALPHLKMSRVVAGDLHLSHILQNSARIIRVSVFGTDEHDKVRGEFRFSANNLVITSIDIQSVEPVDQRTRDALQKSVQLAIEITTNSQEAAAR